MRLGVSFADRHQRHSSNPLMGAMTKSVGARVTALFQELQALDRFLAVLAHRDAFEPELAQDVLQRAADEGIVLAYQHRHTVELVNRQFP